MLTTLEANFVQEFKMCGNATQAYKQAGFKYTSPTSARIGACRLLKKPEIIETLANHQAKLLKQVETPSVTIIPQRTITLPTREEYASKAWERSDDNSPLKPDTKFKYFDLAGRVLGHVKNDARESPESQLSIICNELNVSLVSGVPTLTIKDSGASPIASPVDVPVARVDNPSNQFDKSSNVVDVEKSDTPTTSEAHPQGVGDG